jgi:hypothetical protein
MYHLLLHSRAAEDETGQGGRALVFLRDGAFFLLPSKPGIGNSTVGGCFHGTYHISLYTASPCEGISSAPPVLLVRDWRSKTPGRQQRRPTRRYLGMYRTRAFTHDVDGVRGNLGTHDIHNIRTAYEISALSPAQTDGRAWSLRTTDDQFLVDSVDKTRLLKSTEVRGYPVDIDPEFLSCDQQFFFFSSSRGLFILARWVST